MACPVSCGTCEEARRSRALQTDLSGLKNPPPPSPSPPAMTQKGASPSPPLSPSNIVCHYASAANASSSYGSFWNNRHEQAYYSPFQATGPPNNEENCLKDSRDSWAAASHSDAPEWLWLTFPQALLPTRIAVLETMVAPSVTSVDIFASNSSIPIYTWANLDNTSCGFWLEIELPPIQVPVHQVLVRTRAWGQEEIDSVQLCGFWPVEPPPPPPMWPPGSCTYDYCT
eukprot:5122933-Prymnesium_polylepis.1